MFWVIAACLVVIATAVVVRRDVPFDSSAFAQLPTTAGARGVFAFSGQLTKGSYGVFVVDTDAMTIWAYEYNAQRACLRLAGARTWRYDRYLENHNLCDLPPDVVEKMVEEQRQERLQDTQHQTP